MSDKINCRNCIHFNDLEHRCCLNDGNEIKKECYFILSKRKPKGKDIVIENLKTKIADLEAKLEEKEVELELARNTSINTNKMDIIHLQVEIAELKQQLAESEEKCNKQWLQIQADTEHIQKLKQQLADKETRITELEDKDWYEGTIKQLEEQNERLLNKLTEKEKEIEDLKK